MNARGNARLFANKSLIKNNKNGDKKNIAFNIIERYKSFFFLTSEAIKEPVGSPKMKTIDENNSIKSGMDVRNDRNKANPRKKYALLINKAAI